MRTLPAGLQQHLDTGATTLCWCWRLTRQDGTRQGFTDHDRDLVFDGTTFEAATGFVAGDVAETAGLGVDTIDVEGALSSNSLTASDLLAGLYDDARAEVFRVNWQALDQRVLMRVGSIGEVKAADSAFTAAIRSLSHYLQEPRGRVFQCTCDAKLGDERCGVDLSSSLYRASVTVIAAETNARLTIAGSETFESGWFSGGTLTFSSGNNSGHVLEIKQHQLIGLTMPAHQIDLWDEPVSAVAVGDSGVVVAGCDKHFATCKAKFENARQFRGFPFMPGNDHLARIASRKI